ncbi:hypothetical protein CaCOL14_004175 [Colletotrichum acutatum]
MNFWDRQSSSVHLPQHARRKRDMQRASRAGGETSGNKMP